MRSHFTNEENESPESMAGGVTMSDGRGIWMADGWGPHVQA